MKQNNPMWASTSILVAAVLAIIAFVRSNWQIPLLVGAFAIWGLRVFMILGLPALRVRRNRWEQKRKDLEAEKDRKRAEAERNAAENDPEAAQALLRHVNRRISDQLKALYPEARWEWKTNPVGDPRRHRAHPRVWCPGVRVCRRRAGTERDAVLFAGHTANPLLRRAGPTASGTQSAGC